MRQPWFHWVCVSRRELELSPVPGSAEGQSLHIPAEPELHLRVTPVSPRLPATPPPVKIQDLSVWSSVLCPDVAESYGRSAPVYLTARVLGADEGVGGCGGGVTTNLPAKSLRLAMKIHYEHKYNRLFQLPSPWLHPGGGMNERCS